MVQWFKKKHDVEPVSEVVALLPHNESSNFLSFNKEELWKRVQEQWGFLYELRGENSWKLLMAQIERIKNIYVLDTNLLKKKDSLEIEYARHQGRIEALTSLEKLVQTEMERLKTLQDSAGQKKNGEKSMIKEGKKQSFKKAGPSLSF